MLTFVLIFQIPKCHHLQTSHEKVSPTLSPTNKSVPYESCTLKQCYTSTHNVATTTKKNHTWKNTHIWQFPNRKHQDIHPKDNNSKYKKYLCKHIGRQ